MIIETALLSFSQEAYYTLDDVLNKSNNTYSSLRLKTDSLTNALKHKIFRGQLLPNISLSADLPDFDKSINSISQYDGTYKYLSRTLATSSVKLDVSQLISLTGGTIKYSIGLNRLDNLNLSNKSHSYYLNIGNISYSQNFFGYNSYKWSKLQDTKESVIEAIQYAQERERNKYELVEAFFNLLIQQKSRELYRKNFQLSKYVWENAKVLYKENRISEAALLETEIEYLHDSIFNNDKEVLYAQNILGTLLKSPKGEVPIAVFNDSIRAFKDLKFNTDVIVERCLKYNFDEMFSLSGTIKESEIAKAKADKSPSFRIEFGGGYNSHFNDFKQTFKNPVSSYHLTLSLSIPIFDGGVLDNKFKLAQLEYQKMSEQNELDKKIAKAEIIKELSDVNIVIQSINYYKRSLSILLKEIMSMKIRLDFGRIEFEQFFRFKSQYNQNYLEYLMQIKKYYLYIYKYRFMSLFDIESNIELYNG